MLTNTWHRHLVLFSAANNTPLSTSTNRTDTTMDMYHSVYLAVDADKSYNNTISSPMFTEQSQNDFPTKYHTTRLINQAQC